MGLNIFNFQAPLVLKKFNIENDPADGNYVEIVGRKKGLIAWLLSILGLDNTTSFLLSKSAVSYKTASLFGETTTFFPLPSIASTACGFSKPIALLFLGVFVLIFSLFLAVEAGSMAIVLIGLVVAAIMFVLYFFQKTITLSVESAGGKAIALTFSKSFIEGVGVDINKANEAIEMINSLVVASQSRN